MQSIGFTSGGWREVFRKERLRRFHDSQPALGLAVWALAGVLAGDGSVAAGLGLAGGLVFFQAAAGSWRWILAGGAVAWLAWGLHGAEVERRRGKAAELSDAGWAEVAEEVRVRTVEPQAGGGWTGFVVSGDGSRLWAVVGSGGAAAVGERWVLEGVASSPGVPRNPGEFDRREWLDRQGAWGEWRVTAAQRVAAPPWWRQAGNGLRQAFREAVTRGLEPGGREAEVVRAVVLGDRPRDDGLLEPFRLSGTLHLFAVSGLHVGMVGALAWLVLSRAGVSRRPAVLVLVAAMFGYAWLTGLKEPALRAASMGALVLGAFWFRRRPALRNALGWAGLWVLLRDGDSAFRPGVQLSFGVVLVIGLGFGWASRWGRRFLVREESYLPRVLEGGWTRRWRLFRERVADGLAVSAVAWAGSAPLTWWHFGLVTPVSVVASVAMSAVVFAILGLALLSAGLAWMPGNAAINRANGALTRVLTGGAEVAAAAPGAWWEAGRERPAGEFLMVFDVGAGGAACWTGGRSGVLIDGGSADDFRYRVGPALRRMGLRPERAVATHPDGAHVGGLNAAAGSLSLREALVPVVEARSPSYREWVRMPGARVVRGRKGERYELGGEAWLDVLAEPEAWEQEDLADERVMPVRLNWRGWRILFRGDGGSALDDELEAAGARAEVVVTGRHAFDPLPSAARLEAWGARAVVVTHADFPASERMDPEWRAEVEGREIAVIDQGESGAVAVTIEGEALVFRGYVDGREVVVAR